MNLVSLHVFWQCTKTSVNCGFCPSCLISFYSEGGREERERERERGRERGREEREYKQEQM